MTDVQLKAAPSRPPGVSTADVGEMSRLIDGVEL
jgi:hypothetical protein